MTAAVQPLTKRPVFQTVGGSIFLSAGQTAFINKLLSSLSRNVPSVNAAQVLATGLGEIQATFDPALVPGITRSYLDGLHVAFVIAIVLAGLSLPAALLTPRHALSPRRAA